ncbi:Retrovirus-related Pol polyprotein from transposon TNT 1-94 [Gossypium australe]|uniref:Retrovirus-related Pol polyprotein from transposon TNT 1-94 n=1 Tax=Gossypium australe TaxID=47621 RepID=A0A5B6WT01_9ROSI|nr:Retrovirus-related Pol polyprotein from transposon TNT 1-94 [Gossypium australe]
MQSPRQWYKKFNSFMLSIDDGSFIYYFLYVDDMLIVVMDPSKIDRLKTMLNSKFKMEDFNTARKIVGMEISRDRYSRKLFLSQQRETERILKQFAMQILKPVITLLAIYFKLFNLESPQIEDEEKYTSKVPYSNAVGSLMYAMVHTRLNISHVVDFVSRYMYRLEKLYWQAVKWILRYLRGTYNVCLEFGRNTKGLVGYMESNYAEDLDQIRYLTGYLFAFRNCAISWKAMLQSIVALSTTEVGYMKMIEVVKKAIWLRSVWGAG